MPGKGWRKPEPVVAEQAPWYPMPRWCNPPPPAQWRYKLDAVPATGNDTAYHAQQRAQKERRRAL